MTHRKASSENFIVVTSRSWGSVVFNKLQQIFGSHVFLIQAPSDFQIERVRELSPRYIFVLHWNYKIPSEIYDHFETVIFHMTDLPYGRGGSPLQNLILRGHSFTKISAIQCIEGLDAGNVYLKENLTLQGTADEIFLRAADVIYRMIKEILQKNLSPTPQTGEAVNFKRLTPSDGSIEQCKNLSELFDKIRMLDGEGYPPAFLETSEFLMEFTRASLKHGHLIADVKIFKKEESHD